MNKQAIIEIVKIIANAIIAIIAALTVTACTASISVSKYNSGSKQTTTQEATNKMDSINYNLK